MKNFKIGKKLMITFSAVLLLLSVMAAAAFYSLSRLSESYSYYNDKVYQVSDQVGNMRAEIQSAAKFIMYAITDPENAKAYLNQAQACLNSLSDGIDFLYEHSTVDRSVIDGLESALNQSADYESQVFQAALDKESGPALEIYYSRYYPILSEANHCLMQIDEEARNHGDLAYQEARSVIRWAYIIIAISAAVIFAAVIFLAFYTAKSLTRPIEELECAAKEIANGNLKAEISYRSKDELGSLAESMRQMTQRISYYMSELTKAMEQMASGDLEVKAREKFFGDFRPVQVAIRRLIDNLNSAMTQINESADQVANGSEQVSYGSQALSQGATEQASAVQELAATINEISRHVSGNAESAQEAGKNVVEAVNQLMRSNEYMEEMVQAMDEITGSSREISNIIKTIEDIAFQTNLLALNAAVEAARAGEAGKGFAVVANEVKNLAGKSAEASKSTSRLIESSLKSVNNGGRIAAETAQALRTAVEGAKAVTTTIEQIAKASGGQAASIAQVNLGIDQISSVVQTNSATAQESAAASEELSGQAQMLKQLVGRFKLDKAGKKGTITKSRPFYGEEAGSSGTSGEKY